MVVSLSMPASLGGFHGGVAVMAVVAVTGAEYNRHERAKTSVATRVDRRSATGPTQAFRILAENARP
jgi:hypothetical protein